MLAFALIIIAALISFICGYLWGITISSRIIVLMIDRGAFTREQFTHFSRTGEWKEGY